MPNKRDYDQRKANGKCTTCGKEDPVPGCLRCTKCIDYDHKNKKTRYLERIAANICYICGKAPAVIAHLCIPCYNDMVYNRIDVRFRAMNILGGPKCKCCHIADVCVLTLDHIVNCGSQNRVSSDLLYQRIVNGSVDISLYQMLCFNCQFAKQRNNGVLPTQNDVWLCCDLPNMAPTGQPRCRCNRDRSTKITMQRRERLENLELYTHYSSPPNSTPKCWQCGETNPWYLTLGHLNDDGYIDRALYALHDGDRRKATRLYKYLRDNDYPPRPDLAVECANCNFCKSRQSQVAIIPITQEDTILTRAIGRGKDWGFEDLTNQTFGDWLVLSRVPSNNGHTRWLCRCLLCNGEYMRYGNTLRSGKSTRCIKCVNYYRYPK